MRIAMIVLGAALIALVGVRFAKQREDGPLVRIEPLSGESNATQSLTRYWELPEFSLTERSGRTVTRNDLQGKVWVADFFYSSCPGTCPMLSSRLSDVHKALAEEGDVRFVSISTDPEKDTLDVLNAYAKRFGASDHWYFLTGEKGAIHELANKGFKLSVTEDPSAAEPITHSTKLVLVDRAGVVRGFYEGLGEEGSKRLISDIRRLLQEKQ